MPEIGFVDPSLDAGDQSIQVTPQRAIGPFAAQVTLEERHVDDLAITDHPVETGATISDHAYMRPSEVTIRCGWSESPGGSGGGAGDFGLGGLTSSTSGSAVGAPREMYQNLLELQRGRIPFEIFTGKRIYQNMLVRSLQVTTDHDSENILMVTAVCREVILVSTQVVSVDAPAEEQEEPESTQPTAEQGQRSLAAVGHYDAEAGAASLNASGVVYQLPEGFSQDPVTGLVYDADGSVSRDLSDAVGVDRAEPQRSR